MIALINMLKYVFLNDDCISLVDFGFNSLLKAAVLLVDSSAFTSSGQTNRIGNRYTFAELNVINECFKMPRCCAYSSKF